MAYDDNSSPSNSNKNLAEIMKQNTTLAAANKILTEENEELKKDKENLIKKFAEVTMNVKFRQVRVVTEKISLKHQKRAVRSLKRELPSRFEESKSDEDSSEKVSLFEDDETSFKDNSSSQLEGSADTGNAGDISGPLIVNTDDSFEENSSQEKDGIEKESVLSILDSLILEIVKRENASVPPVINDILSDIFDKMFLELQEDFDQTISNQPPKPSLSDSDITISSDDEIFQTTPIPKIKLEALTKKKNDDEKISKRKGKSSKGSNKKPKMEDIISSSKPHSSSDKETVVQKIKILKKKKTEDTFKPTVSELKRKMIDKEIHLPKRNKSVENKFLEKVKKVHANDKKSIKPKTPDNIGNKTSSSLDFLKPSKPLPKTFIIPKTTTIMDTSNNNNKCSSEESKSSSSNQKQKVTPGSSSSSQPNKFASFMLSLEKDKDIKDKKKLKLETANKQKRKEKSRVSSTHVPHCDQCWMDKSMCICNK